MGALRTWDNSRLFWRALAASLALHLLLALFLPIWTTQEPVGLQPVEAISFAHIVLRSQIEHRAHQSPPKAVPQTTHRAPVISYARVHRELSAPHQHPTVRPQEQIGPQGRLAAAPIAVKAAQTPLYAQASAAPNRSAIASQAAPSPHPMASQAAVAVAGEGTDRGGLLPFGASQDPVLDPAIQAKLQKQFNVHVTLLVTVGENGRTEHVVFQPPIDAQTEHAIEAMLADANWDAAVCGGGVTCQGVATIKL